MKKVIFSGPKTIVLWADGYATVQEWILAAVRRYLAGRKERAK